MVVAVVVYISCYTDVSLLDIITFVKASTMMSRGDRIIIETPGGGGWGAPVTSKDGSDHSDGDKPAGLLHTGLLKGSLVERVANQLGV